MQTHNLELILKEKGFLKINNWNIVANGHLQYLFHPYGFAVGTKRGDMKGSSFTQWPRAILQKILVSLVSYSDNTYKNSCF